VPVAALLLRVYLETLAVALLNDEELVTCLTLMENKLIFAESADLEAVNEFEFVVGL
jgi:hypothetical protein